MNPRRRRLILLLGLLLGLGTVAWWRRSGPSPSGGRMTSEAAEAAARQYLALEAREQSMAESLWGPELDAERHEDEFVRLWDALNVSSNRWATLAAFPLREILLPEVVAAGRLPHDIQVWRSEGGDSSRPRPAFEWVGWLQPWERDGWTLVRTTWTLTTHHPASDGAPARSVVRATGVLENSRKNQRASLRGTLDVRWARETGGVPEIDRVIVTSAELLMRAGVTPFRLWLEEDLPVDPATFNDPLLVRDLDGDGRSDILLVGANRVWWNESGRAPGTAFSAAPAGPWPAERVQAAVLADVNGDGSVELVLAGAGGVRWLSVGPGRGFSPLQPGWVPPMPLRHPQALTAGDVDGDGDLDLWLVQYKLPYQQGQFPTPWFDANDGFPSYLLLNDGHGNFTDATAASGLAPKRFRRSYSASFVDLDEDGDLDLVNVSDFAGLDLFLNDGRGHFTDVTATLGEARHGFGMAHVVNDLNADGRPDLLMMGMGSTVAGRLDALGLARLSPGEPAGVLGAMTWGNRLFLGGDSPPAPLTAAGGTLARGLAATGWSWGAAWADFDHDGALDLAVANGHETRAGTRDYERQFWRHDRFVAASTNDPAADFYFRTAAGRRQAEQASYGGWQDNEFRLNVNASTFPDVAWLFGVAMPADSRNLVAEDLDGDGRLDLILTTQEEWPRRRQRLVIYRNELAVGNWTGFRFAGAPPPGTRIELELGPSRPTRWLLTGDGFRSQGPAAVHFGLGTNHPTAARIIWPDGRTTTLPAPEVNRWNPVAAPTGR